LVLDIKVLVLVLVLVLDKQVLVLVLVLEKQVLNPSLAHGDRKWGLSYTVYFRVVLRRHYDLSANIFREKQSLDKWKNNFNYEGFRTFPQNLVNAVPQIPETSLYAATIHPPCGCTGAISTRILS